VRDRLPALLVVLALVAAFAARLLWSPGLLGAPGAEVYGHAWVQWWHGVALPAWPAGTDLASGTDAWPVIDPLPTALAALVGRLLGPVSGYNTWILLSVPLAFFGGARLARQAGGDPWVGGLTLALWPPLVGSLASGLTEDAAIGLAALAFSTLGLPGWRAGLWTGLALGALAWCGLVNAWFAALAAVGLGLVAGLRDRRAWPGLLLGAVVAAALVAPLALMQGDRLLGVGHRSGAFTPRPEPLWRLNPWRGIDLLSLLAPGRQDPGDALIRFHPGYLGLSTLGLAVWGGWSRWWPVLLLSAGVALGPGLSAGGQPLGISNPFAAAAALLPGGGLLNHHGRALLLGGVAMAALASRGAARLSARGRRIAAVVVALDLALLSPLPLPLPTAPAAPPAAAAQLGALRPGPVLVVPAAGPGVHFQRPLFDQRAHGRRLLLSPNRPGLSPGLMRTDTGRWLAGLAFPEAAPPPESPVFPPAVAVVLAMPGYAEAVTAGLGPPDVTGADGSAAWEIGR